MSDAELFSVALGHLRDLTGDLAWCLKYVPAGVGRDEEESNLAAAEAFLERIDNGTVSE
jgi:hypothetical protein